MPCVVSGTCCLLWRLAPERGLIVTNGDFAAAPLQKVFSIGSMGSTPALRWVQWMPSAQGVSIEVSGKQADGISLIEQEIPLSRLDKQYSINYNYRLVGAMQETPACAG